MAKNKINPSVYLKPHLKGLTPEEVSLVQRGFRLGLEWAKDEVDHYIKMNERTAN